MKSNVQEILTQEVNDIYKEIVRSSIEDGNGIYWKTVPQENEDELREDIYMGSSGIMVFLIEYYKFNQSKEVCAIIEKGANWLLNHCMTTVNSNGSFYTGRTGTIYTLIQASIVTENDELYSRILKLPIFNSKSKFDIQKSDLLNGISGTIIGLLLIYNETFNSFLKKLLVDLTRKLIKRINVEKKGMSWKTNSHVSLCGVSHGNSGIALVFMELGVFFENPLFLHIAEKAFKYENQFFDKHERNWPDFRNVSENKLIENDNFFKNPGRLKKLRYVSSWCHGAPGIGLTRIRAFQIFKKKEYYINLINSGKNIVKSRFIMPNIPPCLCHGHLGNYFFFLEMYKQTKNKEYLNIFIENCLIEVAKKVKKGFYLPGRPLKYNLDLSFFLGISGVGYSYIQSLNPSSDFNYLLPSINQKSFDRMNSFGFKYFFKQKFKASFPLTLNQIPNQVLNKYLIGMERKGRETDLKKIIQEINDPYIKFLFKVEKRKNQLSDNLKNEKNQLKKRKYSFIKPNKLNENELFQVKLKVCSDIYLYKLLSKEYCVNIVLYPSNSVYKIKLITKEIYQLLAQKKIATYQYYYNKLNGDNQKISEFIKLGLLNNV